MLDCAFVVTEEGLVSASSVTDALSKLGALRADREHYCVLVLQRPDKSELAAVARAFALPPLAVEDTLHAHQRAKMDSYGSALFTVAHPATWLPSERHIRLGEMRVFTGARFAVVVRDDDQPDGAELRSRLDAARALSPLGPLAVLYVLLDAVVDDYLPVLDAVEDAVDDIEEDVFAGVPDVARRIYRLHREVIDLQRVTEQLLDVLNRLIVRVKGDPRTAVTGSDGEPPRLAAQLTDVADHLVHAVERVASFRDLLTAVLQVAMALSAQRQNDQVAAQNRHMQRLSTWAAVFVGPTLVAGIYGMNFRDIPGLTARWGFVSCLVAMAALALCLALVFRGRR